MGFICSYIFIGIMGSLAHRINRNIQKKHKAFIAYYSFLIVAIPLILDILIYIGSLDFIWKYVNQLPWLVSDPIQNGQDFMWNAFRIFGLNLKVQHTSGLDAIAVILFLSYPAWYISAKDGSRMFFGQKSYERGYLWVLEPPKKPKQQKN
ncbi:MAG: hypothetical protein ACTSU2_01510 [Promethearchaeota archaeon]